MIFLLIDRTLLRLYLFQMGDGGQDGGQAGGDIRVLY